MTWEAYWQTEEEVVDLGVIEGCDWEEALWVARMRLRTGLRGVSMLRGSIGISRSGAGVPDARHRHGLLNGSYLSRREMQETIRKGRAA